MHTTIVAIIIGAIIGLYPHFAELETKAHQLAFQTEQVPVTVPRIEKEVWVTAYSSTPEETDDTPFITAAGTDVRSGIVAANFLAFGTQVQIPELFGDEVFVVEDRMHRRKSNFVDVWMSSKEEAKQFGITKTKIVVLN